MTERVAAIDAQCVDIQNDRQHKGSIKITLHLPVERGQELTKIMGTWPTYADPVPVALARLNLVPQPAKEEMAPAPEPNPSVRDNRYAKRAGILCNDRRFQGFLIDRYAAGYKIDDPVERREWAADKVRELCEVDSRADIQPNTPAANRFDILESAYLAETRI